ncbi:hypothetical protein Cgig2_000638 [Carnegiea gigantea]|uniref:Uncharacterized protein n=1 Tax=Carnegiea gigantea TaxID=171969 RepID=A0A9Q1GPC0_9CARY|nr:hypothetical protein Cgig2_000638 [Carnegiea gigantea]
MTRALCGDIQYFVSVNHASCTLRVSRDKYALYRLDSRGLLARCLPQLGGYAPKGHAPWRHLLASRLPSKACQLGSCGRAGRKGALLGDWRLQMAVTWRRFPLGVDVSRDTPVHSCLSVDYKCSGCGRRWAAGLVKRCTPLKRRTLRQKACLCI